MRVLVPREWKNGEGDHPRDVGTSSCCLERGRRARGHHRRASRAQSRCAAARACRRACAPRPPDSGRSAPIPAQRQHRSRPSRQTHGSTQQPRREAGVPHRMNPKSRPMPDMLVNFGSGVSFHERADADDHRAQAPGAKSVRVGAMRDVVAQLQPGVDLRVVSLAVGASGPEPII